jgi:membrane associated rhomboid family serine protease
MEMKKGTLFLMALNLIFYSWLAYLSEGLEINRYYVDIFGLNRSVLLNQGFYWQVLTSFFLHFQLSHLTYNVLFLLVFGYLTESAYGWSRTLIIYMVSGLFVSITAIVFYPTAVFGGASGAVMGLVGALLAQKKNRRPIAILVFAVFLFASVREVYVAHFAGLVSGFLLATIFSQSYPSSSGST